MGPKAIEAVKLRLNSRMQIAQKLSQSLKGSEGEREAVMKIQSQFIIGIVLMHRLEIQSAGLKGNNVQEFLKKCESIKPRILPTFSDLMNRILEIEVFKNAIKLAEISKEPISLEQLPKVDPVHNFKAYMKEIQGFSAISGIFSADLNFITHCLI